MRITYEYILFHNLNDTLDAAKKLAKLIKITPCKINLIEYNQTAGITYKKSTRINTMNFIKYLEERNIIVTFRRSKGKDISAACGQLVNVLQQ